MTADVLDLWDQPATDPGPMFAPIPRGRLDELPGVEPLLADTLDRRTLAVLAGPPGAYKTFVALAWACSLATGTPWEGRPALGWPYDQDPMSVLYVAAEGAPGMAQRIRAWETAHGLTADRLDVVAQPVNLLDDRDVGRLVDIAGGNLDDDNPSYDLVVLDTLSRCAVGANENSAQDMSRLVHALDRVRRAREDAFDSDDCGGVSVLVLHHSDKAGRGLRGSNVLEAAADTIYRVAPIGPAGKAALLSRTKRKDGPREDTHTLAVTPVAGTDSIVLTGAHRARVRGQDHSGRMSRAEELLSVAVSAFDDGPPTMAELREAAAMPPASFDRALKTLLNGHLLRTVDTDTTTRYEVVNE